MFYRDSTFLILIPGILLALWAQLSVKSTFDKYSKMPASYNGTAAQATSNMLSRYGDMDIKIERAQGMLTDHYDPRSHTLRLSEGVYSSNSIAALGVAAHESGHAMQQNDGYAFLKLRNAAVPFVSVSSNLSMIIFVMGLIMSLSFLVDLGIILFSAGVLFSLITLPVELDASNRALKMLKENRIITSYEEELGVKKVLRAAAMTYVASAVMAILNLARLMLIRNSRNRD
ncbi:MAG: zinc metallopeptidase [Eubacteriales bacterium]|nr:zinc metallopeptidase [Eubacteriales bacterium]